MEAWRRCQCPKDLHLESEEVNTTTEIRSALEATSYRQNTQSVEIQPDSHLPQDSLTKGGVVVLDSAHQKLLQGKRDQGGIDGRVRTWQEKEATVGKKQCALGMTVNKGSAIGYVLYTFRVIHWYQSES